MFSSRKTMSSKMETRPGGWLWAFALLMVISSPMTASAQSNVGKDQLKIIVPFAPGGAVDHIARILANNLPDNITPVVENRSGAGGDIGASIVANAQPDGNTVLLHTSSLVINAVARGKAREVEKQFEPLARVGEVKFVLVVRSNLPCKSFEEFASYVRAGHQLSFGSTGPGTTLHIAGEMLNDAFGLKTVHVPYRGLSPAFTDLIAGNIDFMVTSLTGILPYVQEGQMRALAVFSDERATQLPGVPNTAELGVPALNISNWYGLFTSSQVPTDRRQLLEAMFLKTLGAADVQKGLASEGVSGIQDAATFKKALAKEWEETPQILARLKISNS
jgi:tripartite-type tricarboxylate transporter receptor subunit TctC